jgi:hypothetical protein
MPLFNVKISIDVEEDDVLTFEQAARQSIKLLCHGAQAGFVVTNLDTDDVETVVIDNSSD